MLQKIFFICIFGLLLSASKVAAGDQPGDKPGEPSPDLFTLDIHVGRMGVMIEQGRRGLGVILEETDRQPDSIDGPPSVERVYAHLARVVMGYQQFVDRSLPPRRGGRRPVQGVLSARLAEGAGGRIPEKRARSAKTGRADMGGP